MMHGTVLKPSLPSNHLQLVRGRTFHSIPPFVTASNGRTYSVGELINSGGNAVVHECTDELSGDTYAVKFQVELRGNRRERFQQEVELLRSLEDPHIIAYVADGVVEGYRIDGPSQRRGPSKHRPPTPCDIPFVVLRRATESLSELVRSRSSIPVAHYLGQFIGLAKALVKINSVAIHRDIKPENVLVVGNTWVISDFGLCDLMHGSADLSSEHEKIGPIFWMSPEALNKHLGSNDHITQVSDVFQLASVFWYVACGRHPSGIVDKTDWGGPAELFEVIRKALMHAPNRRFESSLEFFTALSDAVGLA